MAPMIDQEYPDQIAIAVRAAVTDADLFLSYNLPDKALVPLLGVLPQAPRDVRLNQRLAALHTRFQRFAEAAVCCRTLESVFHDASHPDEAVRYGELAARYEQNTGVAVAEDVAPVTAAPVPPPAHLPEPKTERHPEFSVEEMAGHASEDTQDDVSSEWEHALAMDESTPVVETAATAHAPRDPENEEIAETVEEIRFYLEHFMTDQARTGLERLETLTNDAAVVDPLRAAIASGGKPAEDTEAEIAEINADDPATFEIELKTPYADETTHDAGLLAGYDTGRHDDTANQIAPAQITPAHRQDAHVGLLHHESAAAEPVHAETAHAAADELTSLVADLESSLGTSFPIAPSAGEALAGEPELSKSSAEPSLPAEHSTPTMPGWPGATPAKRVPPLFVQEPEPVAHGDAAPVVAALPAAAASGAAAATAPAMMSYTPAPVRPLGTGAQAMHPSGSVDLSEIFGELKHELEEGAPAIDEDPETHYNLGVAFREMGLLDEAIAELQKVCAAIEHGHPFSQTVQTYTWLAQCFLDKGVPEAAIRWYEKALHIPGLDGEARVAINYELGSVCESAHDKPGALRHFTYVYGANIDYRDVAERIQALKS